MRARRGFTLIEAVLASSISGVLLLGLASSMLIVSQALPGGDRDQQARRAATLDAVLDQLQEELATATAIRQLDSGSLWIARSDSQTDDVAYAWSTTDGIVVRRQRGGIEEVVLAGIAEMTVSAKLGDGRIEQIEIVVRLDGADRSTRVLAPLWNRPGAP